jgi:integrase
VSAARAAPRGRLDGTGKTTDAAALIGKEWTPRELRQSFVSRLSDEKVPIEQISRLVGHRSTIVTETVYREQLRPVVEGNADVMNKIFPPEPCDEG